MATAIHFRDTKTHLKAIPQNGYRDMTVANPIDALLLMSSDLTGVTERSFLFSGVPIWHWSERVVEDVTVSGLITFAIRGICDAGFTGRFRARLYKITAGGSDVETFIGQADATADLTTTSATYTFSFTPAAPVSMVVNERFICRMSVLPVAGSFGTGVGKLSTNLGGANASSITFTETIVFKPNGGVLYARRSAVNGIGNFLDLAEVQETVPPFTTGVVATVASGTEIQWTRGAKIATDVAAAAIASTSNASTYVSASFTPVVNYLYLLGVVHSDAAPESTVPTVATTTGLNFVQVGNSLPFSTIASPGLRLTVFRAQKASGLSAGTYTVTLADSGTGCATRLIEVPVAVATGTDGADAVLNVSENSNNASADPSVTLGAFDDANNMTLLFVGNNIATVPTGGTGITVLGHSTYATPTGSVAAAWNPANDTAPDLVLASSAWAAIAVELVVDTASLGLLEWISERVKAPGWTVSTLAAFGTLIVYAFESNALANCTVRVKLFKRTPAGDETLAATWTDVPEMLTAVAAHNLINSEGVLNATVNWAEDDRVVWRPYIVPVSGQTMGGPYIATLAYDHEVPSGSTRINILIDAPDFKAPADPDKDPALLPSRLPLMGA